jgi:acetyl-CoA carboxylase carboxyltransferase component
VSLPHGTLARLTISWCNGREKPRHRTYQHGESGFEEIPLLRDIHPEAAARIELWRLRNFSLERLEAPEQIFAFRATARENSKDERIFVFAEIRNMPEQLSDKKHMDQLWEFEQAFYEGLRVIRDEQSRRHRRRRFHWNCFTLFFRSLLHLGVSEIGVLAQRFEPHVRGLGLRKVVLRATVMDEEAPGGTRDVEVVIAKPGRHRLEVREQAPEPRLVRAMQNYDMKVVRARQLGTFYPYEVVRLLEGHVGDRKAPPTPLTGLQEPEGPMPTRTTALHPDIIAGHFVEYDLDEASGELEPVSRPYGENTSGVVVGIMTHETVKFPEGMSRVWIAADPTRSMGSLAEAECKRILGALELAEDKGIPIEWIPISAGARIAMDSGTENLDWTARVLRKIIDFTQKGGVINLIICGVNVGAQSYWNAEATMLMHTKGALIMTPHASMVLTGKKALEVSGSVSAEDERGIGGYERIMGPNGQAQYFAGHLGEAYHILFEYYRFTYKHACDDGPQRWNTQDPIDRSILEAPYRGSGQEDFQTIGDIFDEQRNPGRKKPFAIREVMAAVIDEDGGRLERYKSMRHADTSVVWDVHLGGIPTCLIGFESRPQERRGRIPMDGPDTWTGGTLYPQSSKKVARAINAASGNRPVVVLANLSGFDGSPESLRKLQLEMGAEIGRSIVNFEGPIVFVVIGRYHGGAYVVFSKALNPSLTTLALEGTFASVIGGGPAAAVVFPHKARQRTERDPRLVEARAAIETASEDEKPHLREKLDPLYGQILLEKQGEIAREFDAVHTVERAVSVGSIDAIVSPASLRPAVISILQEKLS